jgi:hypothetical protein
MRIFQCDLCAKQFRLDGNPNNEILLAGTYKVRFEYTGIGTKGNESIAEVCPDCKKRIEAFVLCKPVASNYENSDSKEKKQ